MSDSPVKATKTSQEQQKADSVSQFYSRYGENLYSTLMHVAPGLNLNHDDALDAIQDTMLQFLESPAKKLPLESYSNVLSTAINFFNDRYKQTSNCDYCTNEDISDSLTEEVADNSKLVKLIEDEMEEQPTYGGYLLELHCNNGLTLKEIGKVEDMSANSVAYQMKKYSNVIANSLKGKGVFYGKNIF